MRLIKMISQTSELPLPNSHNRPNCETMEALRFEIGCGSLVKRIASCNLDLESTLRKAIALWENPGQSDQYRLFYGDFYLREFLDQTSEWDFERRLAYLRECQGRLRLV